MVVACEETHAALVSAGAPTDFAHATDQFRRDELVHVELCESLLRELGEPASCDEPLAPPALSTQLPPFLFAAEQVVRHFCVGEALSVPLLHAAWRQATHPRIKLVLRRIITDEAAHGQFGWQFLDWAKPALDASVRAHLGRVAAAAIADLRAVWDTPSAAWTTTFAREALGRFVLEPLRARGIIPWGSDTTVTPVAPIQPKTE